MSTSKGNFSRKRPQKHQNKTVFRNDLHDTSRKTKMLNSLEISGVCKRCKDILDWKIKYKKYKPLTAPAKCVNCGEKSIKHAYHVLCQRCALQKSVCAKCCKPPNSQDEHPLACESSEENQEVEVQSLLKSLPERKRRTVLRYINKQGIELKGTPEVMALIEDVMAGVIKINLEDDDFEFSDSKLSGECDSAEEK